VIATQSRLFLQEKFLVHLTCYNLRYNIKMYPRVQQLAVANDVYIGGVFMSNIVTNIKRWGNSQGIMLPKNILSKIGIKDPVGQEVELISTDNELIIRKKTSISRLMAQYGHLIDQKPDIGEREFDWGSDVGNEIID
jgi:antitoxin MazE